MDVHQLSYGCPSVFILTSVSFYIDIHQYFSRRPSGLIRKSICISVDVHQLSYGRLSDPLLTSISTHLDIHHLFGHSSATKRTTIRTCVDVHQLSYGCPSVFKLTSSVFILTSIRTYVYFHRLSYGRPSSSIRISVEVH